MSCAMNAAEHIELAELQISNAITAMESEEAPSIVHAMLAQARATLALVEQQRIANLIALVALSGNENVQESSYDEGSTLSSAGMHALIEYVRTPASLMGEADDMPMVRSGIAKALGLS